MLAGIARVDRRSETTLRVLKAVRRLDAIRSFFAFVREELDVVPGNPRLCIDAHLNRFQVLPRNHPDGAPFFTFWLVDLDHRFQTVTVEDVADVLLEKRFETKRALAVLSLRCGAFNARRGEGESLARAIDRVRQTFATAASRRS